MRDFDITGFVNFPNSHAKNIKAVETGKTQIYLVAIDFESEEFSKLALKINGEYIGDDVSPKKHLDTSKIPINELIGIINSDIKSDINLNKPFISSVLIGWSKFSYQVRDDIHPWYCSFRELTNEGKRLYYSFKKLHNDKEVRLLTFNNIQK